MKYTSFSLALLWLMLLSAVCLAQPPGGPPGGGMGGPPGGIGGPPPAPLPHWPLKPGDPLAFDPAWKPAEKTLTLLDGETVNYRAYEGLFYVTNVADSAIST